MSFMDFLYALWQFLVGLTQTYPLGFFLGLLLLVGALLMQRARRAYLDQFHNITKRNEDYKRQRRRSRNDGTVR